MSNFLRSMIIAGALVAAPFAASGLSVESSGQPETLPWQVGDSSELELPAEIQPPQCSLKEIDETGAETTACCWAFYMGRWWCYPC